MLSCRHSKGTAHREDAGEPVLAKSHLFTIAQVQKSTPVKVKTREEIMAYNRMLAEQRKAAAC